MTPPRRLYVTWRQPSGSIVPVGLLVQHRTDDADRYEFLYLKSAEREPEFEPLPGFPDLHERYVSSSLFPTFANRQMPRDRPDYDAFLQQLDLPSGADPFEVLARSEGRRQTDRIEVFHEPVWRDGRLVHTFFARAVRHIPGASEAIADLSPGDQLALTADRDNEFNSRALLLVCETGARVGYLPDYLVDAVHSLTELNGQPVLVTVEHINGPDTPPHRRLLCRLDAPWPEGFVALSGPDFIPIVEGSGG